MFTPLNRVIATTIAGQGWDYGLIRHPFHDEETKRGARYCVYNRRLMAVSFDDTSLEDQYWLLRRGAGALHTGEHTTEISGPGAVALLDKLFTRKVAANPVGRCTYQFACYADGGMLVDGVLLRLSEDRFWYVQADGDFYPWLMAHSAGSDVHIHEPGIFVSQVQGPMSLKILDAAIDGGLPEGFRYFDVVTVTMGGQDIVVSRSGYTNELGWEFYMEPRHDTQALWQHIKLAGAPYAMDLAGLDAYEPRRIEAGIQNAGSDFDRTTTPFAVGLGDFVNLDKHHFIGKTALERADKGCRFYGLCCADGTPVRRGAVRHDGSPVGFMTCGAWSPYLRVGVGFVRFDQPGIEPGDTVEVQCVDGELHTARVCTLPMYDEERRIPRGLDTDIPDRVDSGG